MPKTGTKNRYINLAGQARVAQQLQHLSYLSNFHSYRLIHITMYFVKSFIVLAAAAALASATPGVDRRVVCCLISWTSGRTMTDHRFLHRSVVLSRARMETTAKNTSETASRMVSRPR